MGLDTENSVRSETKSVQNDTPANTNETCNDGKKNAGDQQVQDEVNHAENGTPVTNGVHQGQQGSTTENEEVYEMIQEPGINIKIISPGVAEPLEIHVSTLELVQEIHQLLMNNEDTCHRTCFSLQLDNVTLDNFADLKGIEGLRDGSVLKVIEEPYTMREARIHVRHVRDLLKCMDPADAYNGIECYSLSFLHHITQEENVEPRRRNTKYDCTPPDYILPETKERLLLPLQPGIKGMRGSPILKVLTTSAWNPPPGPRKLHGDLMYLYVITMEDKRFHITACPRGFYINQSTEEIFIPKPESPCQLSHSLIDLLSHISPIFKRNFAAMLKRRQFRHPFERLATSYQVHTWCAPALEHTIDAIRAEDTSSSKLGYEEHIPGQTRDWNEELQSTRELPRKSLSERLLRERAIFKVHSDFVGAATRGAMAVIDGNVMAINPGEDTKMQMFIWNNIFFSLGFDVRDHYKDLGGDAAAFVAPRNDLHGVRVYSAVDQEGLYTLGTVVVDYRGYRITAQSIIPGILEREQEQSVVYGSIDFGKTVLGHEKYLDMLKRAGQHLRILPHFVLNEKNDVIELGSSVECKGIIGNDGRHYILDLLRTFPPDVNFLKHDDVELSNVVKLGGFPIEHKHKLCCLRQELLDAFAEDRYVQFIRYAAFHLQRLCLTKKDAKDEDGNNAEEAIEQKESETKTVENSTESELKVDDSEKAPNNDYKRLQVNADEAKRIMDLFADGLANNEKQAAETKTVVRQACAKVGSLKDYEFDIRFNPDAFSTVRHTGTVDTEPLPEGLQSDLVASPSNSLKQQRKLIVDAAEFLVAQQIPGFVHSCLDHVSAPMDGPSLIEAIHARGINVRYLGKVATFLGRIAKLEYLYKIAIQELVLRAAKHVFNVYMQNADLMNLSSAISHFLNCLLTTTSQSLNPSLGQDELQQAKRGGKNKRTNKIAGGRTYSLGNDQNYDWVSLTQKSLWQQIKRELKAYWDFDLNCGNEPTIDTVTETFKLNKLTMLRAFCMKVGIQILLREYNFEPKNKPTFGEEDIVNVFPIIKHINPRASDAYNFYSSGQAKIQQGYFKEGFELISEALNLLNNVYGAMHPENAQCLRLLARLSYIMGETAEALSIQQRAVIMSERVNGIDHPHTISEYAHLALYSFANAQIVSALRLLYRARYLALLICGDDHPNMALLDSNIALILHATAEYRHSLRFLEHALAINIKYHGPKSLKVALSYHLVARTQSCMGDFRSALNSEKETYAIYKSQLGEHHEKTQESSSCLRHLTQQAVVLQKKMNDICNNGKITTNLPPIHIEPPSAESVLDMLSAINGILFIQIPQETKTAETENEKEEVENDAATNTLNSEENSATNSEANSTRLVQPNPTKAVAC